MFDATTTPVKEYIFRPNVWYDFDETIFKIFYALLKMGATKLNFIKNTNGSQYYYFVWNTTECYRRVNM